jgi:hypothetical protein
VGRDRRRRTRRAARVPRSREGGRAGTPRLRDPVDDGQPFEGVLQGVTEPVDIEPGATASTLKCGPAGDRGPEASVVARLGSRYCVRAVSPLRLRSVWRRWPGSGPGPAVRRPGWACQRSRVLGVTSRSRRSCVGISLLSALRNARSIQVKVGCGWCRRRTATSCRSTRIATSLVASDRASSASQLSTR